MKGEVAPGEGVSDDWAVYVDFDFAYDRKIPTAGKICALADDECKQALVNFKPLLFEVLSFLKLAGS